ncbi:MAG: hypothetical protein QM655_03880 [Nocardioidaceae bacterium]
MPELTSSRPVRIVVWVLVALLVLGMAGALLANALSRQPEATTETEVPESTASASPSPQLDAAVRVAVKYARAVRDHDAGAIWDIAAKEVQKTPRKKFVAGYSFAGVTNARLSGVGEVGWTTTGRHLAVVPVTVTVDDAPQIGRILIQKEGGRWRFFDAVTIDQVPALSDRPPADDKSGK